MNTRLIRDCLCVASVAGIWPRFIEPQWIRVSEREFTMPEWPKTLDGVRFVHLSDLHFNPGVSDRYLERILKKVKESDPKWIFLTGDTLCFGQLPLREKLKNFFQKLRALGAVFAVLGNHDYADRIAINQRGEYDITKVPNSALRTAFKTLFNPILPTGVVTTAAASLLPHSELVALYKEVGITLLDNTSLLLPEGINLVGLGEHMAGRCDPKTAFAHYESDKPGVILLHNPDALPSLSNYPGELVLCGHTDGGQINIPGIWKRFTRLEIPRFKRGLYRDQRRWIYISRGVGNAIPFRLFSPPEILVGTLKS